MMSHPLGAQNEKSDFSAASFLLLCAAGAGLPPY
jgi:hypothetical protein